ncbi:MAG TPA: hypothetical protein DDW50_22250 [Firmicutes bacterium]|jgi:hypothetical protein|nr:hypothetical protein [Bacillota bacterium]
MKPILEELFYGHIYPFERIVSQDPEYRPLNQKISDIRKTLQEKLPAEDYQALEELLELYCNSGMLESAASFSYGFKLGALIMLEVLGGKGELVRGEE